MHSCGYYKVKMSIILMLGRWECFPIDIEGCGASCGARWQPGGLGGLSVSEDRGRDVNLEL